MNKRDVDKIIAQNEKRKEELFSPYDPVMGIGSPLERVPVFYYNSQKKPVMVPKSMAETDLFQSISNFKTIEEAEKAFNQPKDFLVNQFQELRLDHDFEFWAIQSAKIKPKQGGDMIFFKLNRSQRKLLKELEDMRINRKPIRVILLKARQWGGSTLVQIYMAWIQLRHKTNWNSLIAAHIKQAASNIRGMYKKLIDNYPIADYVLSPFDNSNNIKEIRGRSNKITIGSMETPESIRSDDVSMFHASEVGVWKKTDNKEPEDLVQAVLGTIPELPYSMAVLESTAKGVGNYFHRTWESAKRSENGFRNVFVAWFEIEMYFKEFDLEKERQDFIISMNGYEMSLWNMGATLEGINWYRTKLASMNNKTWRMCSEFPSSANEAFQSTGRRFFEPEVVQNARKFIRQPLYQAEVYADALKGPNALKNIRITQTNNGRLSVFSEPEIFPDIRVLNRYLITLDIGGRSANSDESIIKVFDRYWLMDGGSMEPAAVWAGHIDFDHLAWLGIQISILYDNGYFVPEVNKMREDTASSEGQNFYTIIDETVDHYDNIFCRTSPDKIRQGVPAAYGFHMNSSTKPEVCNSLNAAYRDSSYLEFDERACDQADTYEVKQNGSLGAVDGAHDDHVIATGIGTLVGLNDKYMPPPKIVKLNNGPVLKKRYLGPSTI